jgi:hypothetical protein
VNPGPLPGWLAGVTVFVFLAVIPAATHLLHRAWSRRQTARTRARLRAVAMHPASRHLNVKDLAWLGAVESAGDPNTTTEEKRR